MRNHIRYRLIFALCACFLGVSFFVPSRAGIGRLYAESGKEEEALFVAQKAMEDGFYDVALSLLERFLKNYPSSPKASQAELSIGQCYFYQNRFLDALNKFEWLGNQPEAHTIKDAIVYWIAEVHFRGNNFSKAAEYYKEIISDFPKSNYLASAYYSLGWCLFQQQQYKEALEYFRTVEQKFPKEAQFQDTFFKIVECLYNLKDYAGVKEKINASLKLYSKDPARLQYLYFYLGEAEYYLNNFAESIEEYSKASSKGADDRVRALSELGLGWAYLKLKQYPKAQAAFQGVHGESLEKKSVDVLLLGKAIVSFETGGFNQARQAYEELARLTEDPVVLIQAYLGEADSLYNLGQYSQAKDLYTLALNKIPPAISGEITDKLHYGLAWTLFKEGEFKEAIKEFRKIVTQSEDKIVKVSALCQIGDAYQDSGDYDKARETYDTILREYPDSLYSDYVQYQLGITLLKESDYDAAILSFLALKRNFPSSKLLDDASYALGLAYFQKQDYNSSRQVFERFQGDFKDSSLLSNAMYLWGSSLYNLGKYTEAIDVFKNILRVFTQDTELCQKAEYEIADCYYQMGDEKEAMARFKTLRTKYPDSALSAEIMWWLGEYYYRHNDLTLAGRYFYSLIQDFPRSSLILDAYYILGSIYEQQSKYPEAKDSFRKVMQSGKTELSGQAAVAVADIYLKEGNFDSALTSYQDTLKEHPNLASLIYPKIADLFFRTKKYDEAIAFYRKSLEAAGARNASDLQFKIGESRQAQGKADEAVEEYLKVTYLYPESTDLVVKSLLRVAAIYEGRGNAREAAALYKKITAMDVPESKYARERLEELKTAQ